MTQAPTVGRTVHYVLSENNAATINKRRADAAANQRSITEQNTGFVVHTGNRAEAGQVLPLIITRVWSEGCVNGQLLLDGNDTLWLTSVTEATDPQTEGRWAWPPRV